MNRNSFCAKTIIIFTACIILLLSPFQLYGCSYTKKDSDGVTVEIILCHLEKKYNDEFSLIEISQGVEGGRKLTVRLRSKRFPDEEIIASSTMSGYNDIVVGNDVVRIPIYKYEDNYIAYKHRSVFMSIILEYTQDIYGECKVCYTIPDRTLPDGMGSLDFDLYIKSSNSGLAYTIFLPPSAYSDDYKEKMERLFTKYAENLYQVDANVYYLSRQEDYDGITNENYYDRITLAHADKGWYTAFGYYHLDGAMNAYCEWRKGESSKSPL